MCLIYIYKIENMSPLKSIFLFSIFFSSAVCFAQYTDVINSNRPSESMSAFSVGKAIFQAEAGVYGIHENHYLVPYDAKGLGTDIALRWGVLFEEFEIDMNAQYQKDTYQALLEEHKRAGIKKFIFGGKYLLYDPFKNHEEKINVLSWKANHSFKWRQLIPSVALYAGMNINFDSPFSYAIEPRLSPKVMLITQNQFPGSNVFVFNLFYDKISSLNPTLGYIMTYTKGYGAHWSVFLENKGVKSDYYSDGIFSIGGAYLFDKSIQVDASISTNYKNTPSLLYGGFGMSWRFDKNYKPVKLKNIKKNKSKKGDKKEKDKKKKRLDEVETPIKP